MPKTLKKQFKDNEGCIYLYDLEREVFIKVCDVDKFPPEVRKQIMDYLDEVEESKICADIYKKALQGK
jgi:hypothetical protein